MLRVGGEAGWGIASAADIFSLIAIKLGYKVFASKDYASQIRGGHNYHTVRISKQPVLADIDTVDILLALDKTTLDLHSKSVAKGGIILIDEKIKLEQKDNRIIIIPLKLIEEKLKEKNIHNAVFLGAAIKCLGIEFSVLDSVIADYFQDKPSLIKKITTAAKEGFNAIPAIKTSLSALSIDKSPAGKLSVGKNLPPEFLTGNDAIAKGALKAGLTFLAQYPMTPATGILHHLAKEAATNQKLIVVQPEDEIAAINFAVGASIAGARAMTATSGGGFALMVETYGLAGMAEVPLVIIEGQRPGPATGLPTKTGQGDLKFVLSAAPGDFPRVVIAPGDIGESYTETKRAFYLAEKYQLPAMVLVDKHLCESFQTINLEDIEPDFIFNYAQRINIIEKIGNKELNEDKIYRRYADGNLKRHLPGNPEGIFTYAGDEHNEVGYIIEDSKITKRMNERRMGKLEQIKAELPVPKLIGPAQAETTIISWGSNKGAIIEAMEKLNEEGKKTNFLPIKFMCPFQDEVKTILEKAKPEKKRLVLVEANYSAQLGSLIREKTGIDIEHKILRYDGKVFTVDDIYNELKKIG